MEEIRTVEDAASHIVKMNSPLYSKDLLQLLPEELLQRKVSKPIDDSAIHEIVRKIDEIRYEKEVLSMLPINTEDTKNIEIETKFLFSVAAFIAH